MFWLYGRASIYKIIGEIIFQDGKQKGEFDFLIICEASKRIYQIEVKDTYKGKYKDNAANQLENGMKLLEEKIPFWNEESWKHVKIMCFGDGLSGR